MTQEAAQYQFWNSFGLTAYPSSGVPQNPQLPYITYQPVTGYFGQSSTPTIQIWMWTESEAAINEIVHRIGERIGFGGLHLSCDGGSLWVQRGNPFCIQTYAQDEPTLKVRQLNINIQFLTTK